MKLRILLTLFSVCVAVSTYAVERNYTVSHDQLVEAAIEAIAAEAHVYPSEITQSEVEKKGGRFTRLRSTYIDYSRVQVDIDSTKGCSCTPLLKVQAHTDKIMNTEHKEWEQRIHEVVTQKLMARSHGEESKPTSLPFVPVVTPADSAVPAPKDKQ